MKALFIAPLALIASTSFLPVSTSATRKPICFVLKASANESGVDITQENYVEALINSFSVEGHHMEMLDECWEGFDVQITSPPDAIFLANRFYNFSVSVHVRQPGKGSVSNDTTSSDLTFPGLITPQNYAFARLILCDVRMSGICVPYATTTEAQKVNDATLKEEFLNLGNTTSEQGSGVEYLTVRIPVPDLDSEEFHVATPYRKIALRPTINVTIDNNGSANVFTADGQLVAGTGSYVNQGATLIVSLNVTSGKVKEDRTFLLIGKHR